MFGINRDLGKSKSNFLDFETILLLMLCVIFALHENFMFGFVYVLQDVWYLDSYYCVR
jgi:hypothetical protein